MAEQDTFPDVYRDASGLAYHIKARKNELNGYVLSTGSPERARLAAGLLKEPKLISENRGLVVYNGFYKEVPITVFCSGMGPGSAEITYTEILSSIDFALFPRPTIIRAGTAASWNGKITVNDIAVELGIVRSDGTSKKIAPLEWPAKTDLETNLAIAEVAHGLSLDGKIWFGTGICKDTLYADEDPKIRSAIPESVREEQLAYERMGAISASMESSPMAILTDFYNSSIAPSFKRISFSTVLLIVSPYYRNVDEVQFNVDEKSQTQLVELALESLKRKKELNDAIVDNRGLKFDFLGAIKLISERSI